MKRKLYYEAPAILRKTPLRLEGEILAGSVVNQATIISNGQQVTDIDAGSTEFDWNNNWTWGE